MNRLFPLPIYTFFKIASENGGFSFKGLKHIPSWLVKTLLFEPLRWSELALYNKKINQHQLTEDPVFILGFYRSGTSYLHQFLTQDDRFGYHSNFQMVFPEVMLTSEKWLSAMFESIFRLFKIQDPVHRTQLSFRFPGEEDGSMTTSLDPRGAAWGYFFPKAMVKYFQNYVLFENMPPSEIEEWKLGYVYLVKKISLACGKKPLLLKSPPNTARVKLLLSLFPNAKFIFIHRNPYDVYASNKRFLKVTHSIYAIGKTKSLDVNSIILDTFSQTMHRYRQERSLIPNGQLVELAYDDFIQDPVKTIKKTYSTLKLNDFSYCENKMTSFAALQNKFIKLNHSLSQEEIKLANEKLEPLIREWNYPLL